MRAGIQSVHLVHYNVFSDVSTVARMHNGEYRFQKENLQGAPEFQIET